MADWTKPDLDSTKSGFPGECRALATSAGKLSYDSDTNLPTGLLRYNRSLKRLEEWSGAAWVAMEISELADESVTNDALGLVNTSLGTITVTPSSGVWTPGSPHSGVYCDLGSMCLVTMRLAGAITVDTPTYLDITFSANIPASSLIVPVSGYWNASTPIPISGTFNHSSDTINIYKPSGDFEIASGELGLQFFCRIT